MRQEMILYLDDARGQYIPRDFVRETKRECIEYDKQSDLDYLARGPGGCLDNDHTLAEGETVRGEFYWDVWQDVLDKALVIEPGTGNRFKLYQDGCLFLVPETWEWNEERETFEPSERKRKRKGQNEIHDHKISYSSCRHHLDAGGDLCNAVHAFYV